LSRIITPIIENTRRSLVRGGRVQFRWFLIAMGPAPRRRQGRAELAHDSRAQVG
jgi:hypothetical protein